MKELALPSPFFFEQRRRIRDGARLGPVADLACGRGRHALAAAADGAHVIAVDRNPEFLASLWTHAGRHRRRVFRLLADLEAPAEIPLKAGSCGAILAFRFLYRPLAPRIAECLRPGGLLVYETFTEQQRDLSGGPSNPEYLLATGELRDLFPELEILDFWEGVTAGDSPTALSRLAARKPESL